MVNVSRETESETEARLRKVIRQSRLTTYAEPHHFEPLALKDFPAGARPDALALVRDDATWSQLVPGTASNGETFALFRFHFPPDADNSGFVGWLATLIKRRFGSGVIVVCGYNAADGGVFDYWGCPVALGADVHAFVRALVTNEAAG